MTIKNKRTLKYYSFCVLSIYTLLSGNPTQSNANYLEKYAEQVEGYVEQNISIPFRDATEDIETFVERIGRSIPLDSLSRALQSLEYFSNDFCTKFNREVIRPLSRFVKGIIRDLGSCITP